MAGSYDRIVGNCRLEISTNASGVLARINVDLVEPPIIIKGFTLKEGIDKEGRSYKQLSAPSYRGKFKFHPNIWMPEELWRMLSKKIISEYELVEEKDSDELPNLDDIPF